MKVLLIATALTLSLVFAPATRVATKRLTTYCSHPSSHDLYSRLPREYPRFKAALVKYFRWHWKEAAIVSYGEGSWHADASNGQYRGTFQMGSSERARYGDYSTLVGQAYAASRYYQDAGWSPWDCVPY